MVAPATRITRTHTLAYFPVMPSPFGQTNRMNKIAGVNEQFGSLLVAARNFANGIASARKGNIKCSSYMMQCRFFDVCLYMNENISKDLVDYNGIYSRTGVILFEYYTSRYSYIFKTFFKISKFFSRVCRIY